MIDEEPREEIVASLPCRRKRDTLEEALAYNLDPYSRQILGDLLDCHDHASQKISCYDKLIREGLEDFEKQLLLLQTIPGIDRESACAILIELGPDIGVSGSAIRCAAWAGVGNDKSAGKRRSGRSRNPTLRKVLIECAHGAARTDNCQFQGYHKALRIRCGTRHRRHTSCFAWCVLRTGRPYRDPETDYEAMMVRRNAPRWIRMLRIHRRAG